MYLAGICCRGGGGGIMNIPWDEHGYPLKQEKDKVQSL